MSEKVTERQGRFTNTSASEDISTVIWEFKNPEDKKKVVWWNPLDWIPKYFSVKKNV